MIHDVLIRPLAIYSEGTLTVTPLLTEEDHLLHRVGRVDSVEVDSDHVPRLEVRSVADEVWMLIGGRLELRWLDLRDHSPTRGQLMKHIAESPTLVLVPFGVAFGFGGESGAHLIRFSTEAEPPGKKVTTLAWDGSPAA
jgi:hypothetical protein